MREHQRRSREMFVPLHHAPGHAQADFGEALVVIGGVEQKAHFFAFDLPHSDACYVRAYPAATAEAWADGHVHAFAFFGRVPLSVLYDNDRCLVARILPDGTRKRAALFSGLLSHYVIEDRYGRPGQGQRQGRASKGSSAGRGATSWCRCRALRPGTTSTPGWRSNAASGRRTSCAATARRSAQRLQRDLEAMAPLPPAPFEACDQATGPGEFAGAGALQDQRLLGAGRLRPPRRLDQGLCRPGRHRLRRRDHRPPSPVLRPRGHGLRSDPLPAAAGEEDRRPGPGGAAGGLGPAGRVPDPAPADGGAAAQGGPPRVRAGPAAAGDLRSRRPACGGEDRAADGRRRLRRHQAPGAVPGREAAAEARPRRLPLSAARQCRDHLGGQLHVPRRRWPA